MGWVLKLRADNHLSDCLDGLHVRDRGMTNHEEVIGLPSHLLIMLMLNFPQTTRKR